MRTYIHQESTAQLYNLSLKIFLSRWCGQLEHDISWYFGWQIFTKLSNSLKWVVQRVQVDP